MEDETKEIIRGIGESLKSQSNTQSEILDKQETIRLELEKHIRGSIERKGKMQAQINDVKRTADGTAKGLGDHLRGHTKVFWWALGILGSVIATVLAAWLLTRAPLTAKEGSSDSSESSVVRGTGDPGADRSGVPEERP